MAWPHFANRRATEAAAPLSAEDRRLIDAALAAGKVTQCPPADVRDTTPPSVFGVHPSERVSRIEAPEWAHREAEA